MYIEHNNKALSRIIVAVEKQVQASVWLFGHVNAYVALLIQHSERMRHIVKSSVASLGSTVFFDIIS
jgi:hypothetical protein